MQTSKMDHHEISKNHLTKNISLKHILMKYGITSLYAISATLIIYFLYMTQIQGVGTVLDNVSSA